MGERLAGGNVAIALLANTIATGAVLVALILTFGRSPGTSILLYTEGISHASSSMPCASTARR
jgi:hypothetical protein